MKALFYILFLCLFPRAVAAQHAYMDSLTNCLTQSGVSTSQLAKLYTQLIEVHRVEQHYLQANIYCDSLLSLARREKDYLQETKSYVYRGIVQSNAKQYQDIPPLMELSKKSAESSNDKLAKAYSEYLQGHYEYTFENFRKAVAHLQQSLSLLESTTGDMDLEFKINYLLYATYTGWNDEKNTHKYANTCVAVAQKSGNKNQLSNAYAALAVAYTYSYDRSQREEDLQRILENTERAAALYHEFPGHVAAYTYAIARNNKASYLLRYYPNLPPNVRKEIEANINESLRVSRSIQDSQPTQASSLGMLSHLVLQDGHMDQAEQYLTQAYFLLQTQNPVYYHTMIRVCDELASLYEKMGKLEKALDYQRQVTRYSKALFDQNQAQEAKRLEAYYQSEKMEQEVQLLTERAESQRKQKTLYIALALMLILGSFFMFRSYHFRLRFSIAQERKLKLEKQEAARAMQMELALEKEEQARLKAEQELLALQQQKLQDEVLANQLHLQHKNEVLQNIKEKLSKDSSLNMQQVIREEALLDSDFEKAKFHIQELHPNFFKNISEHAQQKLTALDFKYCGYLYLGMDTKQIATILNVEPKSVRMTKYRLKKKFGLTEKDTLEEFLKNVSSPITKKG